MNLAQDYPVKLVCRLLDYPRSSYYYRRQGRAQDEEALREQELDYYLVGGHAFYAQQEIFDVQR